MTTAYESCDSTVAQVRLKNLMIQRFVEDRWEDWCGPTDKIIADYYLTDQHTPKYELRVVPYPTKESP